MLSPLPKDANMSKEMLVKWVWKQKNMPAAIAFIMTYREGPCCWFDLFAWCQVLLVLLLTT